MYTAISPFGPRVELRRRPYRSPRVLWGRHTRPIKPTQRIGPEIVVAGSSTTGQSTNTISPSIVSQAH
jgi:hypothetical protein